MGKISISREVAAVRRSLSTLDKALTRLARQARSAGRDAMKSAERPARTLKLSPARRKALQLHGKYMGYVRQLKPRAKEVRRVDAKQGVQGRTDHSPADAVRELGFSKALDFRALTASLCREE